MTEPKPNPTPKEEFLANSKLARAHLANMENPELRSAVSYALAEYSRKLAHGNGDAPHASHYKLAGVHEFLEIFYNLSFPRTHTRTADRGQLNYNA